MSLKKEIQKLLKKHGVRPNTLKGQHFLIDSSILSAIAAYAELEPGDRVVEVGAGVGNLTEELLATDAEVVAIENDPALAALLRKEFKNTKQLSIVQKDVLAFSEESVARPYSVVGNVPYYIAGPIIQKFLESPHQPDRLVFTVQKEVAERLAAEAPKATFLSTVVGLFGKDSQITRRLLHNKKPKKNEKTAVPFLTFSIRWGHLKAVASTYLFKQRSPLRCAQLVGTNCFRKTKLLERRKKAFFCMGRLCRKVICKSFSWLGKARLY